MMASRRSPPAPAAAFAVVLALALAGGPALADPVFIDADADLAFGRFAAAAGAMARVTVGTDGLRTTDNGALLGGSVVQPARFVVRGIGGRPFQASVSGGPTGAAGINLEGLTATCGAGSTFISGLLSGCQLDGLGRATILVGATLVVDAGHGTTSLSAPGAITVQVTD